MTCNWRGVFPAATTHFKPDFSHDLPAMQTHLDKMIKAGVHGMVVLGSVGENTTHEYAEKLTVLEAAKEAIAGRVPMLSGVAESTTANACRYARDCERLGLDGLMVLPAMIYKSDPRETMAHFRAVARASGLPIMVYNNPPAYSVDITPHMFVELMDEPTLVCIKESSDNPRRITDIVNLTGDRYVIFSGVDDLVMESVLLGSVGWVSGLVNAFPDENRALWDLMMAGQWEQALKLYRWYTPLLHLDTHVKLVQYIKLASQETGMCSEFTRPPRLPLEGEERARILGIIRKAIAERPNALR
ncbi:MAG: dihydrodipicolinate synthase family protein [Acidobacteria bacterium]|nr:dihydrodipicolinate synthase family protein [Acidobacteriota bacterium]